MPGNNRAASMEKERWGGEGYLDNRAGDRSTMAAVFSIRHYLIDRVAGLIVRGGYFRAAFVWASATLPPTPPWSSIPLSVQPTFKPAPPQRPCYLVFSVKGADLFIWLVICTSSAEGHSGTGYRRPRKEMGARGGLERRWWLVSVWRSI